MNDIDEDALQYERDIAREPRVVRVPNPEIQKRNRNNRQRGSKAQTRWARLIHGRNVGVLGREDVDDGIRLWEVKARKLPKWIRDAYEQVNRHQGDQLRYVVVEHTMPGKPAEWWVIQKHSQFIDTNGLGLFNPDDEPKRKWRK